MNNKKAKNVNVRIKKKSKLKVIKLCYYMKSPKLPVGPVGKFRLLGGAAPLSS